MITTSTKYALIACFLLIIITNSKIIKAQVFSVDSTAEQSIEKQIEKQNRLDDSNHLNNHFKDIPYQDIKTGSLFFKNSSGYYSSISQNSDYQVSVTGLLARINYTQTFKNESDDYVEAIYLFPLSEDAAVDSLKMEIGDRVINGVIKEKKQAQRLYKKAKKQGKKTSLVSQQRPNMFTTKLANIAPGETIKISLSYLQPVNYSNNEFSIRLPLTITPRFIPTLAVQYPLDNENHNVKQNGWALKTKVKDAHKIIFPQVKSSKSQKVEISVAINVGMSLSNINSHYHPILQNKTNDSYQISLSNDKTKMEQDFYLSWQLSEGEVPKAAFFTSEDNKYHYGLLMVMPSQNQLTNKERVINKEVIYIIDTSGSMGGVAIVQAKKALVNAISQLNDNDSFNVIAFESKTTPLYNASKQASKYNKALAIEWVESIEANGGTNMYPAIEQALDNNSLHIENVSNTGKYKQVIFITDGAVGNESELLLLIDKSLGNTRLHTVGIGSAPNGYFMSHAANVGRGTYRYIGNINEVEEEMNKLLALINNPMMQDVALTWSVKDVEMFPSKAPDLYQGQPLVITARWPKNQYNKNTPLNVNVAGKLPNGHWQNNITLDNVSKTSGISTWWARQKIKQLSLVRNKVSDALSKEQLKQEITMLGIQHKLITPFTSFIAVDEFISREQDRTLKEKHVANLMPKGSTQLMSQAIPLSNTSLGSLSYLFSGFILIFISIFLHFIPFSQALVRLFTSNKSVDDFE